MVFLETTISGPPAMHCHCQATQETENVGNLDTLCLAVPSFTHTHTHTHMQGDFFRAFATWQCFSNRVAQAFLFVIHSDE